MCSDDKLQRYLLSPPLISVSFFLIFPPRFCICYVSFSLSLSLSLSLHSSFASLKWVIFIKYSKPHVKCLSVWVDGRLIMDSCVIALHGRAQYISERFICKEMLPNNRIQFSQRWQRDLHNYQHNFHTIFVPKYMYHITYNMELKSMPYNKNFLHDFLRTC